MVPSVYKGIHALYTEGIKFSDRKQVKNLDKLDLKLLALAARGHIVPDRSLLKTPKQIDAIKKSAALNTAVLDHVAAHIQKGMNTAQIDKLVYDFTTGHGGIPAPLNYEGFPKSVCTSVNNVICHGIPNEYEILQEGDIVNVDVSTILDGYYSDASRMFTITNSPIISASAGSASCVMNTKIPASDKANPMSRVPPWSNSSG